MIIRVGIFLAASLFGLHAIHADSPPPAPAPASVPPGGISQARQAWLVGYCVETRFHTLAQVDSLKDLTPPEKAFCKERLKLLNPMIE